jgi:hypothetical protein
MMFIELGAVIVHQAHPVDHHVVHLPRSVTLAEMIVNFHVQAVRADNCRVYYSIAVFVDRLSGIPDLLFSRSALNRVHIQTFV